MMPSVEAVIERQVQSTVASAVHLREQEVGRAAGSEAVCRVLS